MDSALEDQGDATTEVADHEPENNDPNVESDTAFIVETARAVLDGFR